jgi:predicted metalloenzyme YecM
VQEYKDVCSQIEGEGYGTRLVEGMIGGRPISTFLLDPPLEHRGILIKALEVPCPKSGRAYTSGLEHVEICIGKATTEGGQRSPLHSKDALTAFTAAFPNVTFDDRAIDKECNADVSCQVDSQTSIKFHICPLYEVVRLELEQGLVEPVPTDYWA